MRFQVFFQIARQTFRECLRQPVFIVVQFVSLFIIGIHPVISLFVFREQEKLVTDGSLATVLLFGWIIAILCAINIIHREIDSGAVLLILSKPVTPSIFIISKVAGISAVLMLFIWINGIATLLAVRIAQYQFNLERTILFIYFFSILIACIIGAFGNFLYNASFSSLSSLALAVLFTLALVLVYWLPEFNNGYQWGKHIGYSKNLVSAIILLVPAILIMGTIATSLSVYLNPVVTMILCGIIFFWGLISDYLHYRITHLTRDNLVYITQFWPCFLILPLIVFWYFSVKAAYKRLQSSLKYNVFCLASVTGIIGWGIYSKISNAELSPPTALMIFFVNVIYIGKDMVSGLLYIIVPNWQLFWMADALVAGKAISATYIAFAFLYSLCFIIVFNCIALLLFTYQGVGKQLLR